MAVNYFMKVNGVNGESADANHKSYIDVQSVSWGASQAASISGGGAGSGKVSFSDLTITATMDAATPTLLKFCSSGKHIDAITVEMVKASGSDGGMVYSTIVLKDVLVTGTQFVGTSGGEAMAINYSFQAAKVEHHYWAQGKDGSKGAETQMGWDVKQNIATA